jgi:hypothetical protein
VANMSTPHVSGARGLERVRLLWRRERGQATAEYGVVLAVIVLTWLVALAIFWWHR